MESSRRWPAAASLFVCCALFGTTACATSSELKMQLVAKLILDTQDSPPPQLKVRDLWTLPMASFDHSVQVRPAAGQTQGHMIFLDPGKSQERPVDAARLVTSFYRGGSKVKHDNMDCNLHQILFRAPSHHRLMNKEYPLEMFVLATCKRDDQERRVAASFLFEEGPASTSLRPFVGDAPGPTGETSIDLSSFTSFGADYYHYLRHHPAVVDHLLCKTTSTASRAQIVALRETAGRNVWLVQNFD